MRKDFDGLSGLVRDQMGSDALNGSVYLFVNRRQDRMKMLVPRNAARVMGECRIYALL